MNLFKDQEAPSFLSIPLEHGEVLLMKGFLNQIEAEDFFRILKETIRWGQEYLKIYGKVHPFPRETAWYGDEGTNYTYSGTTYSPSPWTPELTELKDRIEKVFPETKFNSVLLNRYRDGFDKVGWHSDNEKAFGTNPMIVSLSLGATRRFELRYKPDKTITHRFDLVSGTLLIMKGELQTYWEHQVPQQKKIVNERINLTFRKVAQFK